MPDERNRLKWILLPSGIRSSVIWAFLCMSTVPLVMLMLIAGWFAFPYVREFYHLERWFPMIAASSQAMWWVWSLIFLTTLISLLGSAYLAG